MLCFHQQIFICNQWTSSPKRQVKTQTQCMYPKLKYPIFYQTDASFCHSSISSPAKNIFNQKPLRIPRPERKIHQRGYGRGSSSHGALLHRGSAPKLTTLTRQKCNVVRDGRGIYTPHAVLNFDHRLMPWLQQNVIRSHSRDFLITSCGRFAAIVFKGE